MTDDERELLQTVAELSRLRLVDGTRVHGEAGPDGFVTGYRVCLADEHEQQIERLVYVTTSPRGGEQPGVLRLHDDSGDERAVWVYPNDPRLPALAQAVVPANAAALLANLDAGFGGDTATPLELAVMAYRPGKRAVVRASRGAHRVYLKVVAPGGRATRIHRRHTAWIDAGIPVPRALGATEDGVVVLAEQPGLPAVEALELVDPERLLDGIGDLRRRIGEVPDEVEARASLASRVDWYTRRTTVLVPEQRERLRALRRRITAAVAETEAEPTTIHGDLHLGQLFVDPTEPADVIGLIDIDTAGTGDPADDDAALWAHLVATAAHARAGADDERATRTDRLADAAQARWGGARDDTGRRRRVSAIAATHLLGHALTGSLPPTAAIEAGERLLAR